MRAVTVVSCLAMLVACSPAEGPPGAPSVSGGVGVVAGPSAFASSIAESQPVASAEPVTFSDGGGVVSD